MTDATDGHGGPKPDGCAAAVVAVVAVLAMVIKSIVTHMGK